MISRCKCGTAFESPRELREHIALLTPRWPAQRCTWTHHDPRNYNDVEYAIRNEARQKAEQNERRHVK